MGISRGGPHAGKEMPQEAASRHFVLCELRNSESDRRSSGVYEPPGAGATAGLLEAFRPGSAFSLWLMVKAAIASSKIV